MRENSGAAWREALPAANERSESRALTITAAGCGAERVNRRRPQLGLDEDDDVGPPVVEEAADVAGDVDRRELMHGALGQALGGDRGRGDGAGGEHHGEPGAMTRAISGTSASVSPTLAACIHATRPDGRGSEARP